MTDAPGDPRSVFAHFGPSAYPTSAPFHPHERYPEYEGEVGSERNPAYDSVRACLRLAGLDAERFGTPAWNPLRGLVRPGETVLLKPNLVKESHPRDPEGWRCVITHGSVVRAVADYVWKALEGRGRVIVADAPQTDSSWTALRGRLGLDALQEHYRTRGLDLEVVDLRREEWVWKDGAIVERKKQAGDPAGYVAVDLGARSEFVDHPGTGRYYGADYDRAEVNRHHADGRHEYLVCGTALKADVIFSLPKLKTHKKAGITASLKNLVGINGDKNWLPHHTEAGAGLPGDERPSRDAKGASERLLVKTLQRVALAIPGPGAKLLGAARSAGRRLFGDTDDVVRSGNWWGNDTAWRMCLDLNKVALYANPDGTLREAGPEQRKRHFVLVDGIVAGEGRGPMNPDPVAAGVVVFGTHPASVDAVCACLIGFDPAKIPIVERAFRCKELPLAEWDWRDVRLVTNHRTFDGPLATLSREAPLRFEPHFGWKGHVER